MDCENCEDFELYYDCDDPYILPEDRKIKKEDNCAVWLCSGSCKKQSSNTDFNLTQPAASQVKSQLDGFYAV